MDLADTGQQTALQISCNFRPLLAVDGEDQGIVPQKLDWNPLLNESESRVHDGRSGDGGEPPELRSPPSSDDVGSGHHGDVPNEGEIAGVIKGEFVRRMCALSPVPCFLQAQKRNLSPLELRCSLQNHVGIVKLLGEKTFDYLVCAHNLFCNGSIL